MHYNPFSYIEKEEDILRFVNALIKNTTNKYKTGGDEFWEKAETLLYCAIISYIRECCNEIEWNMNTFLYIMSHIDVKENEEDYISPVDILFEELSKKDANSFAVRQYDKFKVAAGKTLKSILATTGSRLAPFDINRLREITKYDELNLRSYGKEKSCLFIVSDDSDSTYDFLVALLQTQAINILKSEADKLPNGSYDWPIEFLMDEFSNIGIIPDIEKVITTLRSRNISLVLIIQTLAQLKAKYKEAMDTLIGGCDIRLFLGGNDQTTLKYVSESVGKTTIDIRNISETKGLNGSYQLNYLSQARDLITPEEVGLLPFNKCILFIRGIRPFLSNKYDLTKHKNYAKTSYVTNHYYEILSPNNNQVSPKINI